MHICFQLSNQSLQTQNNNCLKKNHKTYKQNIFYILTSLFLNRDHQLTFVDKTGNSDPFSYQILSTSAAPIESFPVFFCQSTCFTKIEPPIETVLNIHSL